VSVLYFIIGGKWRFGSKSKLESLLADIILAPSGGVIAFVKSISDFGLSLGLVVDKSHNPFR